MWVTTPGGRVAHWERGSVWPLSADEPTARFLCGKTYTGFPRNAKKWTPTCAGCRAKAAEIAARATV